MIFVVVINITVYQIITYIIVHDKNMLAQNQPKPDVLAYFP